MFSGHAHIDSSWSRGFDDDKCASDSLDRFTPLSSFLLYSLAVVSVDGELVAGSAGREAQKSDGMGDSSNLIPGSCLWTLVDLVIHRSRG